MVLNNFSKNVKYRQLICMTFSDSLLGSRGVLGVSIKKTPRPWRGVLDSPVSVANITIKEQVMPTSKIYCQCKD